MAKNKKFLRISFFIPMSGGDWSNISSFYHDSRKKKLSLLILKMDDTLMKKIQLTDSLSKDDELFLKGLILGYSRCEPLYEYVEN